MELQDREDSNDGRTFEKLAVVHTQTAGRASKKPQGATDENLFSR